MPSTITGDATGIAAHDPVSFSAPAGGDARSASSVSGGTGPFQKLANFAKYLMVKGTISDFAETVSALWTFAAGIAMSSQKIAWSALAANEFRLIFELPGGTYKTRIYMRGLAAGPPAHMEFIITFNAGWNGGSSQWDRDSDNTTTPSLKWMLSSSGKVTVQKKTGTASWGDGAWASQAFINPDGAAVADDLIKKVAAELVANNAPSILSFGMDDLGNATSQIRYLTPGWGQKGLNGTGVAGAQPYDPAGYANFGLVVPRAGVLRRMYVNYGGNAGVGGSTGFLMYKNGATTGIGPIIAAGGLAGNDVANEAAVAAGDRVCPVWLNNAGLTVGPTMVTISIEYARA